MSTTFRFCSHHVNINYDSSSVELSSLEEFDSMLNALLSAKHLIDYEYNRVIERRLTFLRNKSVFRLIPREIFYLIFVEASQTNDLYRMRGCHTLAISQTCQAWRSIALGLPCLWSTFTVEVGPYSYRPYPVDLHLLRSGTHPLSIKASLNDSDHCDFDQLDRIFAHSTRIYSLIVDATWWNGGLYESLRAHSFPTTKIFQLNLVSHAESVEPSVFETFPALSCFRFPVGLAPENVAFLRSLVTVELDLTNNFELFLRGCSQLETLILTNTVVDLMDWGYVQHWSAAHTSDSGMSITLQGLRKLSLMVKSRHRYVGDALGLIRAPELDHLVIDATEQRTFFTDWCYNDTNTQNYPFHFNPELNSFLEHCSHTLSTLELVRISMTDIDLLQTLQHRPLQSLSILVVGDTRKSLPLIYPVSEQLIVALISPSLLPRLMEANFWSAAQNPNPPRLQTCLKMGKERNQTSCLRRLTVSIDIESHDKSSANLDMPPFVLFIVRDIWNEAY